MQLTQNSTGGAMVGRGNGLRGLVVVGIVAIAFAAGAAAMQLARTQASTSAVGAGSLGAVAENRDASWRAFRAGERGDPGANVAPAAVAENRDASWRAFRAGERGDPGANVAPAAVAENRDASCVPSAPASAVTPARTLPGRRGRNQSARAFRAGERGDAR